MEISQPASMNEWSRAILSSPQNMQQLFFVFVFVFFFFLLLPLSASGYTAPCPYVAGVAYKPDAAGAPHAGDVVKALVANKIPRVRLIDPNSTYLSLFADTGIDLNLSIEDLSLLRSFASGYSAARQWLRQHLVPHFRRLRVTSISVGYGVLTRHPELSDLLLPSIVNVKSACADLSIRGLSISTAHSFAVVGRAFPASLAFFKDPYLPFLHDLLEFEAHTNGAFQIDVFPFHIYRERRIAGVTLPLVMFDETERFLEDPTTKLRYRNLYDVMVDGVIGALTRAGHGALPVLVVGTGWPINENDVETNLLYAANYVDRLVGRLNKLQGTPLRPMVTPVTFVYGLFDEKNSDDPNSYDNNWGIMSDSLKMKYQINFVPAEAATTSPPVAAFLATAAAAVVLGGLL